MNFGEYVNAAGYTRPMYSNPKKYYMATDSLMYFNKFSGKEVDQLYQRIGCQDPLIEVAPNLLQVPSFNVYPEDRLNPALLPKVMTDPRTFYATNIEAPMSKHYNEPFDKNDYHARNVVELLVPNIKTNSLFGEEAEYMRNLEDVLSTVSKNNKTNRGKYSPPFEKCNPVIKENIARFVCDKFLTIIKDNNDDFINTGYFNIGVGIGARYNIPRIQQLIKQLNPTKDGIDLTDINEIKDYIKDSAFYREMMATNRYLALASTANILFNCSDMSRVGLYIDENSPYIKACKNAIRNRDYIQPQAYRRFMKEITHIYYDIQTNPDTLYFSTTQDERNLASACQILDNIQKK